MRFFFCIYRLSIIGGENNSDRDRFFKKKKEERNRRKRRLAMGRGRRKKRKNLLRFELSKESEETNGSAWEKVGLHTRDCNACVPWV